jgi:signal peptidase I
MAKNEKKNTDEAVTPGKGRVRSKVTKKENVILEYAKAIGTALIIALILRQFLFQAFRIPSGSMLDTLQIGDFLFVNKMLYGAKTPDRIKILNWTIIDNLPVLKFPDIREPRQGDIIVFEYPGNRNLDYIKRCVAVAGDRVEVENGVLYVNGKVYESNFADLDGDHSCVPSWTGGDNCPDPRTLRDQKAYLDRLGKSKTYPDDGQGPHVVPEGHIFMMGDNRFNSMDSRYWGDLDTDLIKGKAIFIYWSWVDWKHLPRFSRMGDLIR